ncbi:MAG: hypothetical protein KGJ09_09160 [Candidatus Omnitrophica bacterium]|nr:hypothetical protein [Candidatus Omnitrophota bacterium]
MGVRKGLDRGIFWYFFGPWRGGKYLLGYTGKYATVMPIGKVRQRFGKTGYDWNNPQEVLYCLSWWIALPLEGDFPQFLETSGKYPIFPQFPRLKTLTDKRMGKR